MTENAEQLIQRLRAYGQQLAPHAKHRESGPLIIEATEALAAAVQCVEGLKECCDQRGARLEEIADLAHAGGTSGLDPYDVLAIVRRLTLEYWKTGRTNSGETRS